MKQPNRDVRGSRTGFSLGEVLVVMVLSIACIGGIVYIMVGKSGGDVSNPVSGPIKAADDVVCRSNLQTVRQDIETARTQNSDHMAPNSLSDANVPSDLQSCPVGHEPYEYDPATGEVHCVHAGHEKY